MNKVGYGVLLIIWMLLTFASAITIIPAMCLFPNNGYNKRSTWMEIGFSLKNKIIDL